jgi:H+-transporting ATPase
MLEAAIALQIGLGEFIEAALIGGLLLFNATLGFIQEGRAGAALAALKKRLAPTALVRRDGEWVRLPASELVPGDIIRLSLGALVPADATLASGSVTLDQSMLTGESVPVDVESCSKIYASSLVRRGQAVAEVTATGSKTYFGRTAELVRIAQSGSTEQAAVFGATRNLVIINGTVAVLIVVSAYFMALPQPALIRLALTALLATIPVALPATFTLSAAFSAQILMDFLPSWLGLEPGRKLPFPSACFWDILYLWKVNNGYPQKETRAPVYRWTTRRCAGAARARPVQGAG